MTRQSLIIAIATFITIVAWIIFDVLHERNQVEISPKLQEVIEPLNPDFDTEALDFLP